MNQPVQSNTSQPVTEVWAHNFRDHLDHLAQLALSQNYTHIFFVSTTPTSNSNF